MDNILQHTNTMHKMQFVPAQEDIVVTIGRTSIVMFFTPQVHVRVGAGEARSFTSRRLADNYMAQAIRTLRYQRGFDMYCDGLPEPSDKDERRGWHAGGKAEAQASYSIEDDHSWLRTGAW